MKQKVWYCYSGDEFIGTVYAKDEAQAVSRAKALSKNHDSRPISAYISFGGVTLSAKELTSNWYNLSGGWMVINNEITNIAAEGKRSLCVNDFENLPKMTDIPTLYNELKDDEGQWTFTLDKEGRIMATANYK